MLEAITAGYEAAFEYEFQEEKQAQPKPVNYQTGRARLVEELRGEADEGCHPAHCSGPTILAPDE
jgi:hypothetical protein